MTTLQCCNCARSGPPSAFALKADCAFCPKCRCRAYPARALGYEPQSLTGGSVDPFLAAGYESANAMSQNQNASLLIFAADVQVAKDDLRPYFTQTQAAVASASPPASPALQGFWPGLYSEWLAFDGSRTSMLSASDDVAHATRLRLALRAFQEKLLAEIPSVPLVLVPLPSPGLLDKLQAAAEGVAAKTKQSADDFNTTFRLVALVGGALAAWMIYRNFKMVEKIGPQAAKLLADHPEVAAKLAV